MMATWRVVVVGKTHEVEVRDRGEGERLRYAVVYRADGGVSRVPAATQRQALGSLADLLGWDVIEIVGPGEKTSDERAAALIAQRYRLVMAVRRYRDAETAFRRDRALAMQPCISEPVEVVEARESLDALFAGDPLAGEMYYLLSTKWSRGECLAWWRPERSGYTHSLDEAGVYDETEAKELHGPEEGVVAVSVATARGLSACVVLDSNRKRVVDAALKAAGFVW